MKKIKSWMAVFCAVLVLHTTVLDIWAESSQGKISQTQEIISETEEKQEFTEAEKSKEKQESTGTEEAGKTAEPEEKETETGKEESTEEKKSDEKTEEVDEKTESAEEKQAEEKTEESGTEETGKKTEKQNTEKTMQEPETGKTNDKVMTGESVKTDTASGNQAKTEKEQDEKKQPPRILALSGEGTDNLSKMSPQFSPDIHVYYFLDNGPVEWRTRTMTATVEDNVRVTVNGNAQTVKAGNKCTFTIPYGGNGSKNQVVLTDSITGLSTTYVFHTFGYGISDPLSNLAMVNSEGVSDSENCSSFVRSQNTPIYTASTNLNRIRLTWEVSLATGNSYIAELTDAEDTVLDKINEAAGEEKGTYDIQTKILTLSPGENTFFIQCHGTYTVWVDGKAQKKEGIHTTILHVICNNVTEDDLDMEDATLKELDIFMNGIDGKSELSDFHSEKYTYKIKIPLKDFDSTIDENKIFMKLTKKNENQKIRVTGGSVLYGVKTELSPEKEGCYQVARYKKANYNTADSFTIKIRVTAKNGITQKNYTIQIIKEGKSGMEIPDIYKNKEYNIVYTDPDRCVNLTLASIIIYDKEGNKINASKAIREGYLYIRIENEDIASQTGKIFSGNFEIWLKKPGTTPVRVIYDDGELHFEDHITLTIRYGLSYLKGEAASSRNYLNTSRQSDRIYASGAAERFETVIRQSEAVIKKYDAVFQLSTDQKDEIHAAVEKLLTAKDNYRRSETGRKITSFSPLSSEISTQNVSNKTTLGEIKLPDSLQAITGGEKITIQGITWSSSPAYRETEPEGRRYHFTPNLPAGYVLMEGVNPPEILVIRESEKLPVLVKKTIPLAPDILVQHVKIGTKKEDLILPNLEMYAREGAGDSYGRITVPVLWKDNDGFDGEQPGTYMFRSYLNPAYPDILLYPNTTSDPMQTITVIVDEPTHGSGDGGGKQPGSEDNGNGNHSEGGSGNGTGPGNGNGTGTGDGVGDNGGAGNLGMGNGNRGQAGNPFAASPVAVQVPGQQGNGGSNAPSADEQKTSKKTEEYQKELSDKQGIEETPGSTEPEKKTEWTVSEITGELPVSYKKEMRAAVILMCLLLLFGGLKELLQKQERRKLIWIKK